MSQSIPKTTKTWRVKGQNGFDSLSYDTQATLPELGANDVLVSFATKYQYSGSSTSIGKTNQFFFRGLYPFALVDEVIPGSDGAGEVIAVGSKVTRFAPGAKVLTLFNQGHIGGSLDQLTAKTGLGGVLDGTLRQHGIFNENGLVNMPTSLSYLEAATLPCAALTAWNALYGLKPLKPGDVVLTQGTGGVSIFAVQFAKAAGATVIATTSSDEKASALKKLGVDHVINYKTTPEWGAHARSSPPPPSA
ncbi:hypothetical protein EYC84_000327 [Monilinia fructicola]|uniref:Enoyl reductase (ER) domain-containing protein n=1 Tax=Monilinia fructicola TaxID=38448 RepID=A0A5M9JQL5_MONFR|nr:hypothetical protein EYC84_000327 [Monilinia fructicola]